MDETITKSGVSTWAYDPTRGFIYLADDNSGTISTWSIAANRVVGVSQIGHAVDTLAVTADGRFLIAGETSAVSAGDAGGLDAVDRIDLASRAIDRFTFATEPHEGGVAHLAIGVNNQVLISDWAATTAGNYPLHSFDAEAASPTFSTLPGLPEVQAGSFLFTSWDYGVVLVTEANASGAPLDLYDARSGQVVQLPALAGIVNADFNRGVADVTTVSYGPTTSPSSGYVAVSPGNGAIYVLDTQLHLVKDLTPLFPSDPTSHLSDTITSVQFTDNGRQLFVWDQTTNKISVIDTQTWQRVTTLDAPTGHGETPPDFQQWGVMAFANHDYDLIVDDRDALHVIDLAASLHINLSGTADNDIENGGVGTDSLSGGGGNDTITGGLDGADTLDGGAGDDSLVAGSGPSVMLGGDGADTLNAGYNGAKVSGGAGNDFIELTGASTLHLLSLTELDGDSGDDRFLVYAFPNEALTIDGGTGHNSLEMHYFGYENPAPIVVHLNGDASGGAWVGANLQTVTILDHVANVVGGDASETITAPGVIAGGGGDDFLVGSNPQAQDNPVTTMTLTGADTINGGLGNDTINGLSGVSYLRGDEGNDSINGGSDFDDINGNMGNDTAHGNAGDDWVVGGKDNDSLFGDAGGDVVWGNLGNDTLDGGDGNDQVRGGQGDDSVSGGAGDDYVSGDRGNDTITGGSGADLFHDSQDAGIDRVLDFHIAEGDRVMLDPGTTYTVSQVGSDTIIDMGAGNQMILVGVQMSTLAPGWIFLG